MASLTKEMENYIEHEVQLRVHSGEFKSNDKKFNELTESIKHLDDKLDYSIKHLDSKLDYSIKYLDNKYMLMFSIILGSIWLPAILHYLRIT